MARFHSMGTMAHDDLVCPRPAFSHRLCRPIRPRSSARPFPLRGRADRRRRRTLPGALRLLSRHAKFDRAMQGGTAVDLLVTEAAWLSSGDPFWFITHGVPERGMPAFDSQLEDAQTRVSVPPLPRGSADKSNPATPGSRRPITSADRPSLNQSRLSSSLSR
jgi:hypothetical protein